MEALLGELENYSIKTKRTDYNSDCYRTSQTELE
jgi:hypothetical protein